MRSLSAPPARLPATEPAAIVGERQARERERDARGRRGGRRAGTGASGRCRAPRRRRRRARSTRRAAGRGSRPRCSCQRGQRLAARLQARMAGVDGALEQAQRALVERAGGVLVAALGVERREVHERRGELGVVRADVALARGEARPVGLLGLLERPRRCSRAPRLVLAYATSRWPAPNAAVNASAARRSSASASSRPAEVLEDGGERGAVRGDVRMGLAERRDADLDGAARVGLGRRGVAARVREAAEVVVDRGGLGMLGAERRLDDRQRAGVVLGGRVERAGVLADDAAVVVQRGDVEVVAARASPRRRRAPRSARRARRRSRRARGAPGRRAAAPAPARGRAPPRRATPPRSSPRSRRRVLRPRCHRARCAPASG